MKRFIFASITVFAAVMVSMATASVTGMITMREGKNYSYHSLVTRGAGGAVITIPKSGRGYGVGISRGQVMVMRFDRDGSKHVVFHKWQPLYNQAAIPPIPAQSTCHWTRADLAYFLKHPKAPITRKACEQPVNKSRIRDFIRKNCVPKTGRPITDNRRDWVCPIPAPTR